MARYTSSASSQTRGALREPLASHAVRSGVGGGVSDVALAFAASTHVWPVQLQKLQLC